MDDTLIEYTEISNDPKNQHFRIPLNLHLTSWRKATPDDAHRALAHAGAANEQEIRAAGGRPCLPGRGVWAAAGGGTAPFG